MIILTNQDIGYCEVFCDFASHSFTWMLYDESKIKVLMVGGWIFHGDDRGWSIHT